MLRLNGVPLSSRLYLPSMVDTAPGVSRSLPRKRASLFLLRHAARESIEVRAKRFTTRDLRQRLHELLLRFPARDRLLGALECPLERALPAQCAIEVRIAEVGPFPLVGASERGALGMRSCD